MDKNELQQIASNPAASQRERNAALSQLAEIAPERTADDALIGELLAVTGAMRLVDVTSQQMLEFSRAKGNAASVYRINKLRSAMIAAAFWERFLASKGEQREQTGALISLLYDDAHSEAERMAVAERELHEARAIL